MAQTQVRKDGCRQWTEVQEPDGSWTRIGAVINTCKGARAGAAPERNNGEVRYLRDEKPAVEDSATTTNTTAPESGIIKPWSEMSATAKTVVGLVGLGLLGLAAWALWPKGKAKRTA